MNRTVFAFWAALTLTIGLAAGCGGGGSSTPPVVATMATAAPTPTPAPAASSVTQPVPQNGATLALPSVGGFSGDVTLPANNAPSGTTISLSALAGGPAGGPVPQAAKRSGTGARPAAVCASTPTVLFSLELQLSQTVIFNGFPSFSITLPAGVSTTGETFEIALFGGTTAQATLLATLGPATVSGQTLIFTGSTQQITLSAGQTYVAELYEVPAGACPSPSPSTSATPTAAPSATPTPTPTTVPTSSPAPAAGTVYVLVPGSGSTFSVEAFAPGASGAATPLSTFTSTYSTNLAGIAVDATGRVYVAQAFSILSFAPGASGTVTPSTNLTTDASPWGLTIDANGNLAATNANSAAVDVFAAGATGAASPTSQITGASTQLNTPYQVAYDATGNVYVANGAGTGGSGYFGSVCVFAAGASGNAAPTAVIGGSATGIDAPEALAVDSNGRIYVGNSADNTITVFAPGANGNVAPVATLSGNSYGFSISSAQLAIDASNDLYVASGNGSTVLVFAPITGANPTALRTITGLSNAAAVAVVP